VSQEFAYWRTSPKKLMNGNQPAGGAKPWVWQ